MTHLRRIILVVGSAAAIAATATAGTATPAAADCIGPSIAPVTAELVRGSEVTIAGTGWGDECYDTGPPPPGAGRLGNPIEDIEVGFAQGDTEIVVARGGADAEYRFSVTVAVPATLAPGAASLWARPVGAAAGTYGSPQPVVVSTAPAGPGAPLPAIAVFGPGEPAPTTPPPTVTPSVGTAAGTAAPPATPTTSFPMPSATSGPSALAVVATVVVVVLAIGLVLAAVRRRSPTDADG